MIWNLCFLETLHLKPGFTSYIYFNTFLPTPRTFLGTCLLRFFSSFVFFIAWQLNSSSKFKICIFSRVIFQKIKKGGVKKRRLKIIRAKLWKREKEFEDYLHPLQRKSFFIYYKVVAFYFFSVYPCRKRIFIKKIWRMTARKYSFPFFRFFFPSLFFAKWRSALQ